MANEQSVSNDNIPLFIDDFSLSRLFVTKDIKVFNAEDKSYVLTMKAPLVKDLIGDDDWAIFYSIITSTPEQLNKRLGVQVSSILDAIEKLIFTLGQFSIFRPYYRVIKTQFCRLVPELVINEQDKTILLQYDNGFEIITTTMTSEICDYVCYLVKLCCGVKVEKPITFATQQERDWYLAQQKMKERINKIKSEAANKSSGGDSDAIIKTLLMITYKFPSLTIDYLFNQTLAQIQWLQKHAAGAVSYEVNAQALAAGNMKKGKLDFFIKL